MNEVLMLRGDEGQRILERALVKRIPAIMTYYSEGRWHLSRVLLTELGKDVFGVRVSPKKKSHRVHLEVGQSVGMSFRYGYGYGKFIFDASVLGIESLPGSADGEVIMLSVPEQVEMVQRRSYLRAEVPEALDVEVTLWHHGFIDGYGQFASEHSWSGKLIDISAGGIQIAIEAELEDNFKRGQSIGLRFTPLPHETPLVFNANVKTILPAAGEGSICVGLQMVGLEASPEGRLVLQRLCNVVEQYCHMNELLAEDFESISL